MKKTIILLGLFVVLVSAGIYAKRVGQSDVLKSECERAGGTFDVAATTCQLPDVVVQEPIQNNTDDVPDETSDEDRISISDIVFATTSNAGTKSVQVSGEARGYWYFEASFPVELIVGTTTVATGIAQAQSDWMTEEFVPYVATLTYDSEYSGEQAQLVLKKDNPSGLPENDGQHVEQIELE